MSNATWYTGDSLEILRTLPDESVDLVITSPPFLALRSYLPTDHEHKHREMGSEATPGAYVDSLMLVVEECRRVLAPHGSIAIELGDTFAGSGGAGGDYNNGLRAGQPIFDGSASGRRRALRKGYGGAADRLDSEISTRGPAWPLAKSLSLIPETVRFTMVYGFNPHTGRETEPWRLRNVVRWCRPNPPVGALGDKYRPATTDMAIFAKDPKRYFDLDAVRTEPVTGDRVMKQNPREVPDGVRTGVFTSGLGYSNPAGAPPLDYWVIPTQPYKEAHYATWPRRLLEIPIKSMCPQRVCRECGKASERIVEDTPELAAAKDAFKWESGGLERGLKKDAATRVDVSGAKLTVGWSDCGHHAWRNGIVLDPFAGSGTTLEVATGLGRDAIGIDLDSRNYELALKRVGMFLSHA